MGSERAQLLLIVGIGTAIILGISALVFITNEYVGTVDSRWWSWERRYTYESCSRDDEGNESCTEHTRCRATNSGDVLPATPPEEMPCRKWWGDDEENYVRYLASVRNDDGDVREIRFTKEYWDKFEVGSIVRCDVTLLNVARKVEAIK